MFYGTRGSKKCSSGLNKEYGAQKSMSENAQINMIRRRAKGKVEIILLYKYIPVESYVFIAFGF